MTRRGYVIFALVVVFMSSSINWDDARSSGGSRGWSGGSSSGGGWSSGGGHK